MFGTGNFDLTYLVTLIVCILIGMVVHEFTHAYVGYKLGDTTALDDGRLTLNPLKHIDPFMTVILPALTIALFGFPFLAAKPVPFNPSRLKYDEFGAAMVAAAGPISNLGLAIVGAILSTFITDGTTLWNAVRLFVELNVLLFIFNLIPIPPLDGSRVLYAFAPKPLQEFMERIEPFGFFIILGIILLGGFGGLLTNLSNFILNLLP